MLLHLTVSLLLAKICELLKWIKLSKIKIIFEKHEKFINWGRDDTIVKFGKGHGKKSRFKEGTINL